MIKVELGPASICGMEMGSFVLAKKEFWFSVENSANDPEIFHIIPRRKPSQREPGDPRHPAVLPGITINGALMRRVRTQISAIPVYLHLNNDTLPVTEVLWTRVTRVFGPGIIVVTVGIEPQKTGAIEGH